jgi:hypothetical protein
LTKGAGALLVPQAALAFKGRRCAKTILLTKAAGALLVPQAALAFKGKQRCAETNLIGPSPINAKVTGALLITLAGLGSRGTLLGRFRCAKTPCAEATRTLSTTFTGLGSRGKFILAIPPQTEATPAGPATLAWTARFRCAKTLLTKGAGALLVPHAELDPRGKIWCAKIPEAEATRTVFIDLAGLNPSRRIGYTKTP